MKAKKTKTDASKLVDDDGFYCLRGELFYKWRALDAEWRNTVLAMKTREDAFELEIRKHPDLLRLRAEFTALRATAQQQAAETSACNKEIEQLYGVELKNCAIDDKTGRIHLLGPGGERGEALSPVAAKPKARRKTAA